MQSTIVLASTETPSVIFRIAHQKLVLRTANRMTLIRREFF